MKRTISLIIGIVMLSTLFSGVALAQEPDSIDLDQLQAIADQYDFELIDTAEIAGLGIVAAYDSLDQFELALSERYADHAAPQVAMTMQAFNSLNAMQPFSTNFTGTANRKLGNISLGLDLNATIKYTYFNNASNQKVYTGFTSFTPYFTGFNTGYSFQLLAWEGTPINDFWWVGNQPYYSPTSQSTKYYCAWEGNLKYGVTVGGVLIGVSDYIWNYFWGTSI